MRTGISAATEVGLHGGRDGVELYASDDRRELIVVEHGLQTHQGPVLMRWMPAEIWQHVDGDVAPRVAVLLDLLEHDDPHARREARDALTG